MHVLQHILKLVGADITGGELEGTVLHRDQIMSPTVNAELKTHMPTLRSVYSSHRMPALHQNADSKQRFPQVCLLRQLLKAHGYHLAPGVKSNGYDSERRKRTVRVYTITRIRE